MTLEYFVYGAWVVLVIHSYLLYKLVKATRVKVNFGDLLAILELITQVLSLIKSNPSSKDIEALERLIKSLMDKYEKNV